MEEIRTHRKRSRAYKFKKKHNDLTLEECKIETGKKIKYMKREKFQEDYDDEI